MAKEYDPTIYESYEEYRTAELLRYTFFRDEKTKAALGWILGSVRTFDDREPATVAEGVLRTWGARLLGVIGLTHNLEDLVDVLSTLPDPVLMDQQEDTT